jgi:hypothetical protein
VPLETASSEALLAETSTFQAPPNAIFTNYNYKIYSHPLPTTIIGPTIFKSLHGKEV